jgi:hypothetical protein
MKRFSALVLLTFCSFTALLSQITIDSTKISTSTVASITIDTFQMVRNEALQGKADTFRLVKIGELKVLPETTVNIPKPDTINVVEINDLKLTPPTQTFALPTIIYPSLRKDSAQMTNLPIKKGKKIPKIDYSTGMTFNFAKGNANYATFLPQLDLNTRGRRVQFANTMLYNFGRINGQRLNSDLDMRNYMKFFPCKKLFFELVGFAAASSARGLDSRFTTGAGIGYPIWQKPGQRLQLALNGVVDRSRFDGSDFEGTFRQDIAQKPVQSFGPLLQLKGQHAIFGAKAFLNFDVSTFRSLRYAQDQRVRFLGALQFPVFKNLNFVLQSNYLMEKLRLKGIKPADLGMSAGFSMARR